MWFSSCVCIEEYYQVLKSTPIHTQPEMILVSWCLSARQLLKDRYFGWVLRQQEYPLPLQQWLGWPGLVPASAATEWRFLRKNDTLRDVYHIWDCWGSNRQWHLHRSISVLLPCSKLIHLYSTSFFVGNNAFRFHSISRWSVYSNLTTNEGSVPSNNRLLLDSHETYQGRLHWVQTHLLWMRQLPNTWKQGLLSRETAAFFFLNSWRGLRSRVTFWLV